MNNLRLTILSAAATFVIAVTSGILNAQTDVPVKPLDMAVGESVVIPIHRLERVAIGNPAVADASVFPDRNDQVIVTAKAPGLTSMNIWDSTGRHSWNIVVSHVASRMETFTYDFKNYPLTHAVYDENTTKLVNEADKTNIDNMTAMLTPLVGAENFSIDPYNNRVSLRGTAEEVAAAERALEKLDKELDQVVIEARFVEISQDDLKQMGVKLGAQKDRLSATSDTSGNGAGTGLSVTFDTLADLAKRFNVTLDALQRITTGKTLTNPRVSALDGRTAWILVGEKFPIATRDRDGLVSFTYINTGIVLAIRPRIADNGEINIWLKPEVSSITGWVGNPNSSANNAAPIITTREAMSDLRVKDGDSIIIGGLKTNEDIVTKTKVPVLGDAPIIGKLFRGKQVTKNNSELVIIITPRILAHGEKVSDAGSAVVSETAPTSPGK